MSNPQSFSAKKIPNQLSSWQTGEQRTRNQRTCKATKAKGQAKSAPALLGDAQLLKAMFAYEKHGHRMLVTCSTCSLQTQYRAAWFNTCAFKPLAEPAVTIYLKMHRQKLIPVFEAWDFWWRLLKMILLLFCTMKTPENVEILVSIYRPCNGSEHSK